MSHLVQQSRAYSVFFAVGRHGFNYLVEPQDARNKKNCVKKHSKRQVLLLCSHVKQLTECLRFYVAARLAVLMP